METRSHVTKELSRIYEMGSNQLVLLCGSIRSEKENLIASFLKDKKFFYYRARNASPDLQRSLLASQVESEYDVRISKNTVDECFTRFRSPDGSKLVIVIDEFQCIGRRNREFVESIMKLRKRKLYPGPVMIILSVSSLAFAENDAREIFGDLYTDIDHILKVGDYTFLEFVRAFPKLSVKEAVEAYGIIGGCPSYVARWNGNLSTRDNIKRLVLNPGGYLFNEAETFISSELRELSVYDTILYSMASGNEKLNDLYQTTGYSRAKISVYLKNLAAFDVVEKVVSFDTGGWENTKKGVYRIRGHFIDFWFRFIYPNLSQLALLGADEFYDKYIDPYLQDHIRRYFSFVCREYLTLLNGMGRLPINARRIGTWVGKEGTIDIVAQDEERETICGICNWDAAELNTEDYEGLLSNMKLARLRAASIYLFSATSFSRELVDLSKKDPSIVLVDMTEL